MAYIDKAKTVEWETPQDLFDRLNDEFHFTIDACASKDNAKCKRYFTKEQDGLKQDWTGEVVWCNPPYGRQLPLWIKKCHDHFIGGVLRSCLSLPGRTQRLFMNGSCRLQKCDS